ncbi:MAG TPA: SDR family oxidoreductase [Acidimicrobiales bacterium]|nr:SDR family oxidoreductase [Acidimicrobiales bacterium]
MARPAPHPPRRPAVVTGASSGIGTAAAHHLARAGHPVVLGARRLSVCEEVADAIRAEGGEAAAFALDLSEGESIDVFAEKAAGAFGPVEVLVSNAAQIRPGRALDTAPEAFEHVLRVNLGAAHRLVRAFGPGMVERRRGDLVFVTSDVVAHPRPRMSAYVASKWGLEGFVTALVMELEGTGVRASMVRPGPTLTGMGMDWDPDVTQDVLEEWVRWGLARHGAFMRPDGVAAAIVHAVAMPRGTHVSVIEVQPEAPTVGGEEGR